MTIYGQFENLAITMKSLELRKDFSSAPPTVFKKSDARISLLAEIYYTLL